MTISDATGLLNSFLTEKSKIRNSFEKAYRHATTKEIHIKKKIKSIADVLTTKINFKLSD